MNRSARVTSRSIAARSDEHLSAQLLAIAEIGGDVAWIIDCASCMPTYISASVVTLLGYGFTDFQDQFGGKSSNGALAELCAGLPARLHRFAAGDLTRRRLVREFDQRHKDGRVVPIEVVSTLVVDDGGAASALVGLVRDLSERRAREAEQRRFAGMLNHEFRTPLSTIDGAIQRLEVTGAGADDATRQRYRKISNAVERLIGMLDEYLSPDRMESIGRKRRPDTIDPAQLLEEAAQQVRAAGRGVTLDAGELPGALRCEPEGLRLALRMLVDNALQHTAAETPVALSGRRADGGIELVVRDGGGGVPADETERIFDKFYRARNAGGRPGSGLGLYMARSVVEVHGGSLGMRNLQPSGAEFRIWLPVRGGAGKSVASGSPSDDNSVNEQTRVGAERKSQGAQEKK
jgi:PAS domain S-box-containing protein